MGFDYAYLYPGMNKVLQAGGRVIRSERDRGVIALLDERFNYSAYQRLFSQGMAAVPEIKHGFCGEQNRKILDRTDKSSIIKLEKYKEVILC